MSDDRTHDETPTALAPLRRFARLAPIGVMAAACAMMLAAALIAGGKAIAASSQAASSAYGSNDPVAPEGASALGAALRVAPNRLEARVRLGDGESDADAALAARVATSRSGGGFAVGDALTLVVESDGTNDETTSQADARETAPAR